MINVERLRRLAIGDRCMQLWIYTATHTLGMQFDNAPIPVCIEQYWNLSKPLLDTAQWIDHGVAHFVVFILWNFICVSFAKENKLFVYQRNRILSSFLISARFLYYSFHLLGRRHFHFSFYCNLSERIQMHATGPFGVLKWDNFACHYFVFICCKGFRFTVGRKKLVL